MIDLEKARIEMENINNNKIKKIPISDVFKRKQEKYEYLKANNWKLWPVTPFPKIDNITKWFKKWWIVWIGAFSNTGKSQLSYYYAQHFIKSWLDVAYFSLEVSSEDVLIMINQYYNWVSYKESASLQYSSSLDKLSIYDVWDYSHISEIELYVRQLKPDIIFIDFIQILDCEWASEYDKLSNAIRRLQKLWIETGTTIIYLSQISNESNKETDIFNINLKGSWNLVSSSDYVFIMKRWNVNWEIVYWLKKNKHWVAYKTFWLMFDFEHWKCVFDWEMEQHIETNKF